MNTAKIIEFPQESIYTQVLQGEVRAEGQGWFDDAPDIPLHDNRSTLEKIASTLITTAVVAGILYGIMLVGALLEMAVE